MSPSAAGAPCSLARPPTPLPLTRAAPARPPAVVETKSTLLGALRAAKPALAVTVAPSWRLRGRDRDREEAFFGVAVKADGAAPAAAAVPPPLGTLDAAWATLRALPGRAGGPPPAAAAPSASASASASSSVAATAPPRLVLAQGDPRTLRVLVPTAPRRGLRELLTEAEKAKMRASGLAARLGLLRL